MNGRIPTRHFLTTAPDVFGDVELAQMSRPRIAGCSRGEWTVEFGVRIEPTLVAIRYTVGYTEWRTWQLTEWFVGFLDHPHIRSDGSGPARGGGACAS